MQYDTDSQIAQESAEVSQQVAYDLSKLLAPVLAALDAQLDVRLVRTFLATIAVSIQFRHRAQGLLLSEWGAYLLSAQHAPAATKRISTVLQQGLCALRCSKAKRLRLAQARPLQSAGWASSSW